MAAGFAPGWMRPIRSSQCVLYFARSASTSTYGSVFSGRKKSGGELSKVSPKNPGGVMPTTVNGLSFRPEDATDYGWIGSIGFLPQTVTHHCYGRSTRLIVVRAEHSSGVCSEAKHGEVIARDKLASITLRRFQAARSPDAKRRRSRLKRRLGGRQFRKAFGVVPQGFIQSVGDERELSIKAVPAVVTAVRLFPQAVQFAGIRHR